MPFVSGGRFVFDAPTCVPAVWGDHSEVLWPSGEPLLLVGPPGVGKSTLVQQVVRARMGGAFLGLDGLEVLGYTVTPDPDRRVLYIAADRPAQIARSLRRMWPELAREHVDGHLLVWRGPLEFSLTDEPDRLAELAAREGCGTVVIDSLKDVASPLTEDRVGSGVKAALGALTEAGVEVCALHHQRKGQAENRKPIALDDVYGSAWLTAGAGSVVLLHGQAGEPLVQLRHLKQPANEVGPLRVLHDHDAGRSSVIEDLDAHGLLQAHGTLTAKATARLLFGDEGPGSVERARRKLAELVRRGHAREVAGETPKAAKTWQAVNAREVPREAGTADHGASRSGAPMHHASITTDHVPPVNARGPLRGPTREGHEASNAFRVRAVA